MSNTGTSGRFHHRLNSINPTNMMQMLPKDAPSFNNLKKSERPRDWKSPGKLSVVSLARARTKLKTEHDMRRSTAETSKSASRGGGFGGLDLEVDWGDEDVEEEMEKQELQRTKSASPRKHALMNAHEEEVADRTAFFELSRLLDESKAGHAESPDTDIRSVYIDKCQELNVHPLPIVVSKKEGDSFKLNYYGVGPANALALANSIEREDAVLCNLYLEENGIDEKGCEAIVISAEKNSHLQHLDLRGNQVGERGAKALGRLITARHLRTLDLANCSINHRGVNMLAQAIEYSETLTTLNISQNNIDGRSIHNIISMIEGNRSIVELNLSWNAIHGTGVAAFIETLSSNRHLKRLDISWNRFGGKQHGDMWGQTLQENKTLEYLNISHNHISERNMILICDGLAASTQSRLKQLVVEGNPIGILGGAAVFEHWERIMTNKIDISIAGCNMQVHDKDLYDWRHHEKVHVVEMTDVCNQAAVKVLYRHACLQGGSNWFSVQHTVNGKTTSMDDMPFDGTWEPPNNGTFQFTFVTTAATPPPCSEETFDVIMRILSNTQNVDEMDRYTIFSYMIPKTRFSCVQVAKIFSLFSPSSSFRVTITAAALPFMIDRMKLNYITRRFSPNEVTEVRTKLGKIFDFDLSNPTGHFRLDFSQSHSITVLCYLFGLAKDITQRMKKKLLDMQLNPDKVIKNFPCIRNAVYNNESVTLHPKWRPTENTGILSFDFVNVLRACGDLFDGEKCGPLHADDFEEFVDEVELMTVHEFERVNLSRNTCCSYSFTSKQAATLVKSLKLPNAKVYMAVQLWERVTDLDQYLIELRHVMQATEIAEIVRRLGPFCLVCFDHLEGYFKFNLSVEDEYKMASFIATIAEEEDSHTISHAELDGNEYTIQSPRHLPKNGILELIYDSSRGTTHQNTRKTLNGETLIGLERIKQELEAAAEEDKDEDDEDDEDEKNRQQNTIKINTNGSNPPSREKPPAISVSSPASPRATPLSRESSSVIDTTPQLQPQPPGSADMRSPQSFYLGSNDEGDNEDIEDDHDGWQNDDKAYPRDEHDNDIPEIFDQNVMSPRDDIDIEEEYTPS